MAAERERIGNHNMAAKRERIGNHNMAAERVMTLKLLVDKKRNRVVYAESESDFVDTLFSFLVLPIGTIVRLSNKNSKLGSIDNLYDSVEKIDTQYLSTKVCKSMLLSPRMEFIAQQKCRNLVYNLDDPKHFESYVCSSWSSCDENHLYTSVYKGAKCVCGKAMNTVFNSSRPKPDDVFVKGKTSFMITDDLNVSVVSTMTSLDLLNQFKINHPKDVEVKDVTVRKAQVVNLLRRSLLSKTPLTDVLLLESGQLMEESNCVLDLLKLLFLPNERTTNRPYDVCGKSGPDTQGLSVKLLLSKSKNKVAYAEANEDFLDLLFSFLTFPLGSIIKQYPGLSNLGCVDNLYKSIKSLSVDTDVILEDRKRFLLCPKIAARFGISNELFGIEESKGSQGFEHECPTCDDSVKRSCVHVPEETRSKLINLKFMDPVTESGGGYAKGPLKFIVTDDLVLQPLSPISNMTFINKLDSPFSDLYEQVVHIAKYEALCLLLASLTTDQVLTHVFCPKKLK